MGLTEGRELDKGPRYYHNREEFGTSEDPSQLNQMGQIQWIIIISGKFANEDKIFYYIYVGEVGDEEWEEWYVPC